MTRLLDESRAQAILVTAPAGYGKTTLAAEWLQERSDVVWYRATNASADVAAFSAGLADVMTPLVPGAGNRIKQRLRVADTPERAARPLAELLAEDIADWPEGALLVIDDYHLVADSAPVEDFFDWLLTLAPPQLRVLVTSRRRPRWASARRILYGEITEIGSDQLAMSAEEASRVLGERSGESVRALVTQAEGWPALIGLAALTASHEIPDERVSEALYRYFAEEVVRREAPAVERFMLLASVPAGLDARIAREVLQIDDPEPVLERLVAEGLLHPAGDQFCFHPLLRAFLRRRLEREEPALFRKLTERGIEDARTKQRWKEAFELAIQTNRLEDAGRILEHATPDLLAAGQTELLQRWLDESGAVSAEHPGGTIARAELLIRQGRATEAAAIARDLALRLPSDDARISKAWCLAGLGFHLTSKEMEALDCHLQAEKFARSPQELSVALWGAYMAALELGTDASGYLAELESLDLLDLGFRFRVATGRMGLAIASGSLENIGQSFQPLLALAECIGDPMIESSFLSRVAETQVMRGEYDAAYAVATRAMAVAEKLHLNFAIGHCLLPRIAAEIGLRRFRTARQSLGLLSRISLLHEDPYLELAKELLYLKLALSDSRQAFRERPLSSDLWERTHVGVRAEYLSLRALYSASHGDVRSAMELCGESRALPVGADAAFNIRFADLIAKKTHGELRDAFRLSATTLVLDCSKAEVFDSLVLACRSNEEIVTAARDDGTARLVLTRALLRSHDDAIAHRAGLITEEAAEDQGSVLDRLLTPREREVLTLLTDGLSNSDIARRLVIAEGTAKVHVQHIFKKLGVHTRLQVVLKAKKLEKSC